MGLSGLGSFVSHTSSRGMVVGPGTGVNVGVRVCVGVGGSRVGIGTGVGGALVGVLVAVGALAVCPAKIVAAAWVETA